MNRNKTLALVLACIGCLLLTPGLVQWISSFTERLFGRGLNTAFWEPGVLHFAAELLLVAGLLFLREVAWFAHWFYTWASVLVLLFFSIVFVCNISPVPFTDDAKNFLDFAVAYKHAPSFYAVLNLLFNSTDTYSLLLPHLAVIVSMLLFGKVSFVFLLCLGICFMFLLVLLLRQYLVFDLKTLCLLLLFCNCAYYDALFWSASVWTIVATSLLVGLVLHFLLKAHPLWTLCAWVLSVSAVLTAPYGLLACVLAILLNIYHKRWRLVVLWIVSLVVMTWFYSPAAHATPMGASVVWWQYLWFSCVFLGSLLQFGNSLLLPGLFGMVGWMLFGMLLYKGLYKKHVLLTGLILYVLACSLLAAVFRIQRGLELALSNRYVFFSLLLMACYLLIYLDYLQTHVGNRLSKLLFAALLAYHLSAGLFFFPELPIRKAKLARYAERLRANGPFMPMKPLVTANTHAKVVKAMEEGVWVSE